MIGVTNLAFFVSNVGLGSGGTIGNILFQLQQNGVFSYLLPFLVIFMVLFGILEKINIFKNKGVHTVLSLAVALMALQFNFVSYFFAQIFPRMGVLLSIILVVLVLVGMFWNFDKSRTARFWMGAIMVIGVVVIVFQSFGSSFLFGAIGSGWAISFWLQQNLGGVLTFVFLVGGILAVVMSGKKSKEKISDEQKKKIQENLAKAYGNKLFGMADITQGFD